MSEKNNKKNNSNKKEERARELEQKLKNITSRTVPLDYGIKNPKKKNNSCKNN